MTGEYDKGGKKRKGGKKDRRREKGEAGWHEERGCGGVDVGDGGRVSECCWCGVMKYSVRVCLRLLPSPLFFPPFSDITG